MKQQELFKFADKKKLARVMKRARDNSLNGLVSNFGALYM